MLPAAATTALLADWRIQVRHVSSLPQPQHPLYAAVPAFAGDVCFLEAPGFRAEIRPRARSALLLAHPAATPADIIYFRRVVLALALFEEGHLMVHAAAVAVNGRALLFVGPSGAGKSTVATLAGERPVLHDDLVALYAGDDGITVAALPDGTRPARPYPLAAVLLLGHAPVTRLLPVSPAQALAELVANTPVLNGSARHLPALFATWRGVLRDVSVYRLGFRPDPSMWELLDARFGRPPGSPA